MPCRIELAELELQLRIGCTEEERREPQPVRIRAAIRADEIFSACDTDRVDDTVDAGRLRSALIRSATAARVHTLERLGRILEVALTSEFGRAGLNWEITITKPRFEWSYVHAWRT